MPNSTSLLKSALHRLGSGDDSTKKLLLSKPFKQAWRQKNEPDFEPGLAQIYAEQDTFLVIAALGDRDIYNNATGFNEKTWKSGDVFELFIQTAPDIYYEFHVTPENRRLFLRWTTESFQKLDFEEALIWDPELLETKTYLYPEQNYWTVHTRIPYAKLGIHPTTLSDDLKVAFARYDAGSHTNKPILSATPDFPKPNYHNRAVWHDIRLP